MGALEHAVLSGEAHRVLLAVSQVELSEVMRGAPPMADGSAAVEDRRIPELVNKTVNRIGVVVERARDAGAGKQRRDP